MQIITWGTRGSIPISNQASTQTGGNTTCFEIKSDCLPPHHKLIVDAGTGIIPATNSYLGEIASGLQYTLLFTHWHWDHILGLTLAPPTFIEQIPIELIGPIDCGLGPRDMVETLFRRPYFPVDARQIASSMKFRAVEHMDVKVIVIHPSAGVEVLTIEKMKSLRNEGAQIPFGREGKYDLQECLVITMHPTNHAGAQCVSYRVEEMPTGKTAVILTDHENLLGIPASLRRHLQDADLLVADIQYPEEKYQKMTAGFGHGVASGTINLAFQCGVKRLGITHHDPASSDATLEEVILPECCAARDKLRKEEPESSSLACDEDLFLCRDYMEIEV